jgi:tRNA (guanine-N7-)-methyltransferase
MVTPAFADLVADRLVDGGHLHVATDVCAYAAQVRAVLHRHPTMPLTEPAPWRAATRYEGRGRHAGRRVHDLSAVRRPRRPISG